MNRMEFTSFLTAAAILTGIMTCPAFPATAVTAADVTMVSAADPAPAENVPSPVAALTETTTTTTSAQTEASSTVSTPAQTEPAPPVIALGETTVATTDTSAEGGTTLTNPAYPTDSVTTTTTVVSGTTDPILTNPSMPANTVESGTTAVTTSPAGSGEPIATITNPVMPGMEGTTTTVSTVATMTNPVMPAETVPTTTVPTEKKNYSLGDVNGDTLVNAEDATAILIAAARIGTGKDSGLNDYSLASANVVMDSAINAEDATMILRYSAACGTAAVPPTLYEYLDAVQKKN